MAVCCCSMAGTAACQHCSQNPFVTDVWTNKTVTVNHVEAKPFTNADRIRAMTDEELAEVLDGSICPQGYNQLGECEASKEICHDCWLDWLKQEAT